MINNTLIRASFLNDTLAVARVLLKRNYERRANVMYLNNFWPTTVYFPHRGQEPRGITRWQTRGWDLGTIHSNLMFYHQ